MMAALSFCCLVVSLLVPARVVVGGDEGECTSGIHYDSNSIKGFNLELECGTMWAFSDGTVARANSGNTACDACAYGPGGWASEQDICFHNDQYYMAESDTGEAYCWDGRCMNKRSYGEPCKNEFGDHDNNLCVTGWCDDDAYCQYRSDGKDCRSYDTGKINMVDKGANYNGNDLGECEGDCDNDDHCAGNLKCWHRSPNYPAIPPGCSGYHTPHSHGYDYCYDESKLTYLGYGNDQWDGQPPTNCHCLRECISDCDSDNDCFGGLKCYQRDHGDTIPAGCKWPSNYNTANIIDADFCYDPNKWPGNRLANKADAGPLPADHKFETRRLPEPEIDDPSQFVVELDFTSKWVAALFVAVLALTVGAFVAMCCRKSGTKVAAYSKVGYVSETEA